MRSLAILLFTIVCLPSLADNDKHPPSPQHAFFDAIRAHCGKAFAGSIKIDSQPSPAFSDKAMTMHVRECSDQELRIPFHIGENASRTWVITKTVQGLSLKHDHRHQDGSPDALTQYGGTTELPGWPQVQSFPADEYSKDLFVSLGRPESVGNTWHVYIYPDRFSYRLTREGRVFQVDFDLTRPVDLPPAPWGAE